MISNDNFVVKHIRKMGMLFTDHRLQVLRVLLAYTRAVPVKLCYKELEYYVFLVYNGHKHHVHYNHHVVSNVRRI
jgi:hypothetical protein